MAVRESTRLVREPRQFRDGVRATQDEDARREVGPPQKPFQETEVRRGHGARQGGEGLAASII